MRLHAEDSMTENLLLQHLEEIATRLGVELRYENLGISGMRTDGGYCRIGGRPLILINRADSRRRKILILARSLNRCDLNGIFIAPAVRRFIEDEALEVTN
jgi:hypothetical protein